MVKTNGAEAETRHKEMLIPALVCSHQFMDKCGTLSPSTPSCVFE